MGLFPLTSMGASGPLTPLAENMDKNIIFLDWDDTFLPSGCVKYEKRPLEGNPGKFAIFAVAQPDCIEFLPEIEAAVRDVLQTAIANGRVFIVTNGGKGWVEISAQAAFPSLKPLLDHVKIHSAQAEFRKSVGEDENWKFYTFQKILEEYHPLDPDSFPPAITKHVFSIGDSDSEKSALLMNAFLRGNFWFKIYKLKERRESPPGLSYFAPQLKEAKRWFLAHRDIQRNVDDHPPQPAQIPNALPDPNVDGKVLSTQAPNPLMSAQDPSASKHPPSPNPPAAQSTHVQPTKHQHQTHLPLKRQERAQSF